MTPLKTWKQWDGADYAPVKPEPTVYYYPGKVDIESDDTMDALINEIHLDGVAPSKKAARALLENAIVIHGQIVEELGEISYHSGSDVEKSRVTDATWVELDEYED